MACLLTASVCARALVIAYALVPVTLAARRAFAVKTNTNTAVAVECPPVVKRDRKEQCVDDKSAKVDDSCCERMEACDDQIKEWLQDYKGVLQTFKMECGAGNDAVRRTESGFEVVDASSICSETCLKVGLEIDEAVPDAALDDLAKECPHVAGQVQKLTVQGKIVAALIGARNKCTEEEPTAPAVEKLPLFEHSEDDHVAFLVDASHSMLWRLYVTCEKAEEIKQYGFHATHKSDGTCTTTRFDYMRLSLAKEIESFSPDQHFTIVSMKDPDPYPCKNCFLQLNFFLGDSRVFPRSKLHQQLAAWKVAREEWVQASPEMKSEALTFIRKMRTGGRTPMGAALSFAVGLEDVDVVHVLSDGVPTLGCDHLGCMPAAAWGVQVNTILFDPPAMYDHHQDDGEAGREFMEGLAVMAGSRPGHFREPF